MKLIVRIALMAALASQGTVAVAVPTAEVPASEPIVTCESAPAPDTDGVSIGTAKRWYRGDAIDDVATECDGWTVTGS